MGHRERRRLADKVARALVNLDEPRYEAAPARFPSEDEMLARLDRQHDRLWTASAMAGKVDKEAARTHRGHKPRAEY